MEERILYRETKTVKAGETQRFKINYTPSTKENSESPRIPSGLWVKVKNTELIALRAAYIAGPYVLYVDCKPEEYDPNKKCFITADQPVYEPQLLPGQSFYAELSCHTLKDKYCWIVDVVSQIIFSKTIDVDFEITIGTSRTILHEAALPDKKIPNSEKKGTFVQSSILNVVNHDTLDLWNIPVPDTKKPIHLVMLTHGLHSNIGADMFYLKEQIDKTNKDNIVVKGFFGNIGKTERGIKYLGSRVAEYIIDLVTKNETFNNGKVAKISFVGHSLGGLVQTFAIAYLQNNFAWFFRSIKPINFITIASPLLGVVHENPIYVKMALLAGVVGKTGQDLSLKFLENGTQPLLLLLPTGPTHRTLKMFVRRTVYANIANDGIVPLRTSALLYLDYKGLNQIMNSSETNKNDIGEHSTKKIPENTDLNVDENGNPTTDDSKIQQSIQAMFSYFMPQKQRKRPDVQYQRYQTNNEEGKSESELNDCEDDQDQKEETYNKLAKSSFVETATTLILPPLPSLKYITDPDSRDNVVIHDKIYKESDLPPRGFNQKPLEKTQDDQPVNNSEASISSSIEKNSTSQQSTLRQKLLDSIDYNEDFEHLEEEIAREYHKNMTWRKVLVSLKSDAHNNILVRRRFANAYGWPVIEHIVNNHFNIESEPMDTHSKSERPALSSEESNIMSFDSLDCEVDLTDILSRDLLTKQNDVIDQEKQEETEEKCEHNWINSKDNAESLFAVGPTGLLSDVSEMVGNLKNQWNNYNYNPTTKDKKDGSNADEQDSPNQKFEESCTEDGVESNNGDLGVSKLVMGNFI